MKTMKLKIGGLLAHFLFGALFGSDWTDLEGWKLASRLSYREARKAQKQAEDILS